MVMIPVEEKAETTEVESLEESQINEAQLITNSEIVHGSHMAPYDQERELGFNPRQETI